MSQDSNEKRAYKTDLPQAKLVENWRSMVSLEPIDTIEKLQAVLVDYKEKGCPPMALDTETTSLSTIDAILVGISFCYEPKRAYYIPLTHRLGKNIEDTELAIRAMAQMCYAAERVFVFNYGYDMPILRKYGWDPMEIAHLDVQTLTWNADTNVRFPSLKESALYHLGIKMITYEDTAGKVIDFSYVDPADAAVYAAQDAWCTWLLKMRFSDLMDRIKFIFETDNELDRVMMFTCETPINIDRDRAQMLAKKTEERIVLLEREIHQIAGQSFDINSVPQLRSVLQGAGVPLTATTKTGLASTNEDDLTPLKREWPIIDKILEYRGLVKMLGTYILPFVNHPKDTVLIQYHLKAAPTGRLASGGESKKMKGTRKFFEFNIQSTIKPEPGYYLPTPSNGDITDPMNVLGYHFEPCTDKTPGRAEGYELENCRQFFKPYPDHYCLSIDYDAEEIRIAANLSGDRTYLDAFGRGEDPHTATCKQMFPTVDKALRKIAKTCSFGLLYFGNEYTLQRQLEEKTLEECQEYAAAWRRAHRTWISYCNQCSLTARKQGFITSALGRMRRVGSYYRSPNRRDHAFADRTVANTQVQGLAADIMRVVLVRLYYEVLINPEYAGKVYFMASMHDELCLSIDKRIDVFTKIVSHVTRIMTELPFNWEVPLTVSPAVGLNWGSIFPFSLRDGVWSPDVKVG